MIVPVVMTGQPPLVASGFRSPDARPCGVRYPPRTPAPRIVGQRGLRVQHEPTSRTWRSRNRGRITPRSARILHQWFSEPFVSHAETFRPSGKPGDALPVDVKRQYHQGNTSSSRRRENSPSRLTYW